MQPARDWEIEVDIEVKDTKKVLWKVERRREIPPEVIVTSETVSISQSQKKKWRSRGTCLNGTMTDDGEDRLLESRPRRGK